MIRRLAVVVAAASVAACSADMPMTTSSQNNVVLSLGSIMMEAGDSLMPSIIVTEGGSSRAAKPQEITLSSSDPSVVVVASNDALIAVGDGTAVITVSWVAAPGITATRSVQINAERLIRISLAAPATLAAGDAAALVVSGTLAGGRVLKQPASVTLTSRNAAVVATSGYSAIAIAPGTAWIVAAAPNGVTDSSLITVSGGSSAPATDNGYVQIRWIGAMPSAPVAAAFEAARTRINGLFRSFNGVTAINPNVAADLCLSGEPALNETVKGIVIFAQVTTIDGVGSILGSAGPCVVRNVTNLPIVGSMQFDSADMNAMLADGSLNGVVLHEMMHTLGFGTIWGPDMQNEVAAPDGLDPRYVGASAQSEYANLGANATSGVPVENTGGSGTQGAHWRESVFHDELMTGWADGDMALSRMTIGALRDFGYDVDLNKADAYSLSAPVTLRSLLLSQPLGERTVRPIGVVGSDGRMMPFTGTAH
jgi:hypothetical protein